MLLEDDLLQNKMLLLLQNVLLKDNQRMFCKRVFRCRFANGQDTNMVLKNVLLKNKKQTCYQGMYSSLLILDFLLKDMIQIQTRFTGCFANANMLLEDVLLKDNLQTCYQRTFCQKQMCYQRLFCEHVIRGATPLIRVIRERFKNSQQAMFCKHVIRGHFIKGYLRMFCKWTRNKYLIQICY